MKKIVGIILFILFVMFPLCAQHADYLPHGKSVITSDWISLMISVDGGVIFGKLFEYVYVANDNDGEFNDVLSRLDWQLNPLVYAGITMQAEMWDNWILGVGAWMGIPAALGRMEDRDWGTDALGYTGNLMSYSHHDNVLKEAVFADINFGYKVTIDDTLVFLPLIGFNYKHIFMSGRNGVKEIPSIPKITWEGEVITYQQNYYIFYVGAQISWSPLPFLTMQLFAGYSPITFSYNIDYHVNDATYVDLPVWGQYISVEAGILFHLIDGYSIRLKGNFEYIPSFQGQLFGKPYGSDEYALYTSNRGGGSFILGGAGLALIIDLN
jgi:outer membrane protease